MLQEICCRKCIVEKYRNVQQIDFEKVSCCIKSISCNLTHCYMFVMIEKLIESCLDSTKEINIKRVYKIFIFRQVN